MKEFKSEQFNDWVTEREKELFKTQRFKEMGKADDFVYQALSFIGDASWNLALASTILRDEQKVSDELKVDLKHIQTLIHDFQEKLRLKQSKS